MTFDDAIQKAFRQYPGCLEAWERFSLFQRHRLAELLQNNFHRVQGDEWGTERNMGIIRTCRPEIAYHLKAGAVR